MKTMNACKYRPYPAMELPDREWPGRAITRAPIWCSVDLRDGNQALSVPMDIPEKIRLFELLVEIGFREIEAGFPSASLVEYRFIRKMIEGGRVPDGVTIQVLTQAREHLIRKTFESLAGAERAVVHLYNSTSALQRRVVFRKSREEVKEIAVSGARLMTRLKEESGNHGIRFEYTPESFTGTEMDYALEVCHAVMDIWRPTPEDPVILNLPATVEMATPNVYADQIEWFCRNIRDRESVIISLHTHNDRGTAVAAAELAVMAGADRVEGTLFGNGERTGNLDIMTMALNLASQGVDPGLDFSEIDRVKEIYTACTRMEVHPRHPYAGELVYTAFSGSHQDAISKGMKARREEGARIWEVPYLPIDPEDVGRSYQRIIRINSQSGKGGVGYVMETEFGFRLPKAMQAEFARVVQAEADRTGQELSPEDILRSFREEYLDRSAPCRLLKCHVEEEAGGRTEVRAEIAAGDRTLDFTGNGNGPIDAFVRGIKQALGYQFTVASYDEHAVDRRGSAGTAVAYISLEEPGKEPVFGAGVDTNISLASIRAVLSAVNRMSGESNR